MVKKYEISMIKKYESLMKQGHQTVFPNIDFNDSLFCYLKADEEDISKQFYEFDDCGNLYLKATGMPVVIMVSRRVVWESYCYYFWDVRVFGLSEKAYFNYLNENHLSAIASYLLEHELEKYNNKEMLSRFEAKNIDELKEKIIALASINDNSDADFYLTLISLIIFNIIKCTGRESDF